MDLLRRADPGRTAPFALIALLTVGFGSLVAPRPEPPEFAAAVGTAAALVAAAVAGRRLGLSGAADLLPFGMLAAIAVLRDSGGGSRSGFGALLFLPVLWLALHRGTRAVAAGLVAFALSLAVPVLALGRPDYPPAEWRRVVLSLAVAAVMAVSVNRLVASIGTLSRSEEERTRAIIESQADIASAGLDRDVVMQRIAERATTLTGASGAVIELVDGDDLVYAVATGSLAEFADARVPRSGSLSGLSVERHEPLLCADSELDPRVDRGMCRRVGVRSMIVVPLRRQGVVLGVLRVVAPAPNAFHESDLRTLELLSNVMSSGISAADTFRDVIDANSRLLELDRLQDAFVATVSHELRTPLTSIVGWLHVLLTEEPGELNDEQRRYLRTVKRNSDRLGRLVEDILLASQLEVGALAHDAEELDIAAVVNEAVDLAMLDAAAKDIALAADVSGDVTIVGDRTRLLQLFGNLLSNAVKYTPSGGLVGVQLAVEGSTCSVTVRDTGIGIPPEERERLFERFFRASSAIEHGIQGTGLGLAISRAIAESHGGAIRLPDHDGPGTAFVVDLPLAVRKEVRV